jgi:hypothetical protein
MKSRLQIRSSRSTIMTSMPSWKIAIADEQSIDGTSGSSYVINNTVKYERFFPSRQDSGRIEQESPLYER